MSSDPAPTLASTESGGGGWWRAAALGLACVVIGFAGGFLVRGASGGLDLPPAPAASGGEGGGETMTGPVTVPAEEEPPHLPARGEVQVAVLNGTDINGFAAMNAGQAESLGYVNVIAEDAPEPNAGPSTVYFRVGERQAAQRVAEDLGFGAVMRLPTQGPLATGAPAGATVVVVLGTA